MDQALDQTLRQAAEGDNRAWRRLIDAFSGRVYGLLFRQCSNPELAEELTQATFVKVAGELADYEEQGRFEAWLFRIAMNQLRDEMRRRGRQAVSVDFDQTPPETIGGTIRDQDPSAPMARREREAQLRQAVARLPEPDQRILHMRYTAELSFARIAEILDEPLGTVLARGHRALKKLREMLNENV
jgi:RNA polymerase sigma-70 factor (ECF subfamily)